eukprot:jgi/Tetstr1/447254/TSEL_034691.t1
MDIAHLKEIGSVETHTIFVDSGQRDKTVFKKPNNYDVVFDRPFENVVGMDILDGSLIPTTFLVDTFNNSLAVSYRMGGTTGTSGKPIPEYLQFLQGSPSFQEMAKDDVTPLHKVKIANNYAKFYDAEEDLSKGGTCHVVYNDSVAVNAMSPDDALDVENGDILDLGDHHSGVYRKVTVYQEGSVYKFRYIGTNTPPLLLATFGAGSITYAIVSIFDTVNKQIQYGYCDVSVLMDVPLDDVITVLFENGALAQVEGHSHKVVTQAYYDSLDVVLHEYYNHIVRVEIGDHDIDSLATVLLQAMPRFSPTGNLADMTEIIIVQSFSGTSPKDFSRDRRFLYRARDFFWFDMKKSTISSVLGFSEVSDASESTSYTVIPGIDNRFLFGAIQKDEGLFEVYSPGIINLYGERFVVLRCPQIEENGNASLSYERYTAGIGIFKMYNAQISHLRFDFTNLRRLEMHPLGKLSKITLRFERANGDLYDFKGVDHHLFLAIKFLKPIPKLGMVDPNRRLNPDYHPDVLKFLTTYYEDDLDESSTEDDDDLLADVRHRRRFLKVRANHFSTPGRL